MDPMTDISIERACERLVLDFAHFSDHQEYEALAALFIPEGKMVRPSGDVLHGREAIIASYRSRPAGRMTRHICTNIRISVVNPDFSRGLSYAVVYSANANQKPESHFGHKADPRQLIGEFEDEFVRTEEGWRIASRVARFVLDSGSDV
jgi:hypothetical protein